MHLVEGGAGGGRGLRQGVIVVSCDETAPEPVLLAQNFDAKFLLEVDEGGVADEEL